MLSRIDHTAQVFSRLLANRNKWDKLGLRCGKGYPDPSLPRTMKNFIAEKIREGRFSTPSEYIYSLIRDHQEMTGNSDVAQLIQSRRWPGRPRRITACYPCDKPAAEMKEA